jgi:hypothetical protein
MQPKGNQRRDGNLDLVVTAWSDLLAQTRPSSVVTFDGILIGYQDVALLI